MVQAQGALWNVMLTSLFNQLFSYLMSFIPFQNKSPHTQHTSLHPFTRYISIKVYIESCHCTANCNFQLFSTAEPCTRSLEIRMFLALLEILDLPLRKSSLMSDQSSRSQKDRLRTSVSTIIVTKTLPCLCSRHATICT